jgi:hypothetical protein
MESEELATKITTFIQRSDGSVVRIVAQKLYGLGLKGSIDVYVHRRESADHDWTLCSDKPHPDWLTMSVDDYIKHGRSEMLQAVSPGEILKVTSGIGKPMSCFN